MPIGLLVLGIMLLVLRSYGPRAVFAIAGAMKGFIAAGFGYSIICFADYRFFSFQGWLLAFGIGIILGGILGAAE